MNKCGGESPFIYTSVSAHELSLIIINIIIMSLKFLSNF